jgi:hypothetical protein
VHQVWGVDHAAHGEGEEGQAQGEGKQGQGRSEDTNEKCKQVSDTLGKNATNVESSNSSGSQRGASAGDKANEFQATNGEGKAGQA